MSVNISATFKKDSKPYNGLEALAAELADEDKAQPEYIVVALLKPKFSKFDFEEGVRTPTIKFVHIEPLEGDAATKAMELLKTAYRDRTGRDDDPQPSLFDGPDGERVVPEASGDELLAEHRERQAEQAGGGQ